MLAALRGRRGGVDRRRRAARLPTCGCGTLPGAGRAREDHRARHPRRPAIRRTLRQAALGMTTLHYDEDELERPSTPSPPSSRSRPTPTFRRRSRSACASTEPVAVARGAGRTPRGGRRRRDAPAAHLRGRLPHGEGRLGARRAGRRGAETPTERWCRARRRAASLPLLDRAYGAEDGVRVAMRTGPTLRFGSPRGSRRSGPRRRACWPTLRRAGAGLLDVRVPERPAAASMPYEPAPRGTTGPTTRSSLNPESRVSTLHQRSRPPAGRG